MKYFTKECYELCQKTGFHYRLEEDKRAEVSEQYFKQLYESELNNWITLQEEINSIVLNSFQTVHIAEDYCKVLCYYR